jgi:replication factor A1
LKNGSEKIKMRREFWRHGSRGRYSDGLKGDIKTLRYLAIVVVKYRIDSAELLDHVAEAWREEKARLGQISIMRREKTEDSAVFLFTIGEEVVAQFSIPVRVLQEKRKLENYVKAISASRNVRVAEPKVGDLRVGMKGILLKAKVLEIPKSSRVFTRYGAEKNVSNVLIGDKTGTIRISLWDEQIDKIIKGNMIEIENGTVASFRGEPQLRIGRNGSLKVIDK